MFDFDLNQRIWCGALDAAFACAEATFASAAALQNNLDNGSDWNSWSRPSAPVTANAFAFEEPSAFNPCAIAMAWWQGFLRESCSTPAWQNWADPGHSAWAKNWPSFAPSPMFPQDVYKLFLVWHPWSALYAQSPILCSLMAAGVPFDVANPMSRAATAMMDAGDAMRQQAEKTFGRIR